jgi:hypothetical protein
MNSESKLHYLIDLIDDQSVEVREEIIHQLSGYGHSLEKDLKNLKTEVSSTKMNILAPILASNRKKWLEENWGIWFCVESLNKKIEIALDIISRFHYGIYFTPRLEKMLDQLSEEFKNKIPYGDELDLANFLFQEKEISGAKENYYNPFNSNPIYSIKEKKGLPITLCLIYILIGGRLGFDIRGCNFPGHFLAKIVLDDETILIDCFNGGRIIFESDINESLDYPDDAVINSLHSEVSAEEIITRVLNNIINAYSFINDVESTDFFSKLVKRIPV